jgi:hypothetical protein
MAESAPSLADTDCLNASQLTRPKRPKQPKPERRGSVIRNRSRSRFIATLAQVQVKLLYLVLSFNLLADTYKIATLKINGISAIMRMAMLSDFVHKQERIIIVLRDVAHTVFILIRGNIAYTIVGINKRARPEGQ